MTTEQNVPTVGIVGAGKLGTALGQLIQENNIPLQVTGKPNQPFLEMILSTVLPSATPVDWDTNLATADILVLAVPQPALGDLDLSQARADLVIVDATNAWEASDGAPRADDEATGFAALVEKYPNLALARSLNQAAYTDLLADARPVDHPTRRAIAVAATSDTAAQRVGDLIERIGYDAVTVPPDAAALLDVGGPIFGERLTAEQISERIG